MERDLNTYEVTVGNIGTVHMSTNKEIAVQDYNDYVELSKSKYGRASNESVMLLEDNEPIREYNPDTAYDIAATFICGNKKDAYKRIAEYGEGNFAIDLDECDFNDVTTRYRILKSYLINKA